MDFYSGRVCSAVTMTDAVDMDQWFLFGYTTNSIVSMVEQQNQKDLVQEVHRRTGCLPLSEIIRSRRLCWFGHVARASPELDHSRALCAAIHGQPWDWKRRRGRPAHTWTSAVEAGLKPANIGLFSAWRRAQDRTAWSGLIWTAMPQFGVRS